MDKRSVVYLTELILWAAACLIGGQGCAVVHPTWPQLRVGWKTREAIFHRGCPGYSLFCFNAVDKQQIDNASFVTHSARHADGLFRFSSGWNYPGQGERQSLKLRIERNVAGETEVWHDEHPMVAVSFDELQALLQPYFEVHAFEHDYQKLIPWSGTSGNALFVCVKR